MSIEISPGASQALLLLAFLGALAVAIGLGLRLGKQDTGPSAAPSLAAADQAQAAAPGVQAAASGGPVDTIPGLASRPADSSVPIGDNPRLALPELASANYVIDMGDMPAANGPVSASVTLRNDGVKELVIKDVRSNCSCTSARVEQTAVPPGGETQLVVVHDPEVMLAHGSTDVNHQVTISSNDPAAPSVAVDLMGTVIP